MTVTLTVEAKRRRGDGGRRSRGPADPGKMRLMWTMMAEKGGRAWAYQETGSMMLTSNLMVVVVAAAAADAG